MKRPICISAFLLMAARLASADLFFQPQFSTVNSGDGITIDVMYSGVVSPWLGGYDIDIGYDPALVDLSAVAWPDNFLGVSLRDAIFGTGTVNVAETSLASVADLAAAQTGNDPIRLFELLFIGGPGLGTSPLTFDRVLLADGDGKELAQYGSTPAGSITVTGNGSVPEPSSALWLILGLTSIALLQKRKQG